MIFTGFDDISWPSVGEVISMGPTFLMQGSGVVFVVSVFEFDGVVLTTIVWGGVVVFGSSSFPLRLSMFMTRTVIMTGSAKRAAMKSI